MIIHSVVLWQVHSFFQIKFSIECDLVLTLSISSILSFPKNHPLPVYIFQLFHYLSPIMLFRRQFMHKMWPIQLAFLLYILHTIYLASLTLFISSFLSRSDRLICSLLLQHITELSTVLKFSVCSCGCTPFLWQKAGFWIAVVRSGSNFDNNCRKRGEGWEAIFELRGNRAPVTTTTDQISTTTDQISLSINKRKKRHNTGELISP